MRRGAWNLVKSVDARLVEIAVSISGATPKWHMTKMSELDFSVSTCVGAVRYFPRNVLGAELKLAAETVLFHQYRSRR